MAGLILIVLTDFNEYLKGILQQIIVSYNLLTELNDSPNDLQIMKKELSKIIGCFVVIKNKLSLSKIPSDSIVTLHKLSSYYIETYDFSREIDMLAQVYYNDPDRLKNLRLLIIDSLNDKKLIENFQIILNNL
tara:strand:+ start:739 stop:1137 length:399 start_codon:yes stop_codon:yes gene_type:complete